MGRNREEGVLYFYHQIPASNKANGLPIPLSFCIFPSLFSLFFPFWPLLRWVSPSLCRAVCASKETMASLRYTYTFFFTLSVSNDLYLWPHLLLRPLLRFRLHLSLGVAFLGSKKLLRNVACSFRLFICFPHFVFTF